MPPFPISGIRKLRLGSCRFGVSTTPGSTGTPGQQINEYFVGSTFDSSGNQTADGTQYNWTILFQGENQDALPGVYITPQGAFNPREQSLLAPDLSVIQAGVGAYDPTAGETGFNGWYDRNANTIVGVSETGLALAGTHLTAGLAAPLLSSAVGFAGTAISGALGATSDAIVGAISTAGDIAGASEEAISSASEAVTSWVNDTADSISEWSQNAGSALARNAVIAKAVEGGASGFVSSLSGALEHHDGFWETATNAVVGTFAGGVLGFVGGGLSSALEESSVGWRLAATVGLGAVGGGVSNVAIQGADATFFREKFSWGDVGASALSGGLVSVPFGGADLAIENANTPWLNLVGAGLAPVEGYAHTLTEQGINWLGRQASGN